MGKSTRGIVNTPRDSHTGEGARECSSNTMCRYSAAETVMTKVGRNDACPCGSGKRYKRCCGSVGDEKLPVAQDCQSAEPRFPARFFALAPTAELKPEFRGCVSLYREALGSN